MVDSYGGPVMSAVLTALHRPAVVETKSLWIAGTRVNLPASEVDELRDQCRLMVARQLSLFSEALTVARPCNTCDYDLGLRTGVLIGLLLHPGADSEQIREAMSEIQSLHRSRLIELGVIR